MESCKQEARISSLELKGAVTESHVKDIASSVDKMQKWIMGFIISVMLMFFGTYFVKVIQPHQANADDKVVEVRDGN